MYEPREYRKRNRTLTQITNQPSWATDSGLNIGRLRYVYKKYSHLSHFEYSFSYTSEVRASQQCLNETDPVVRDENTTPVDLFWAAEKREVILCFAFVVWFSVGLCEFESSKSGSGRLLWGTHIPAMVASAGTGFAIRSEFCNCNEAANWRWMGYRMRARLRCLPTHVPFLLYTITTLGPKVSSSFVSTSFVQRNVRRLPPRFLHHTVV